MDIEAIKVNALNVFALAATMMPIERWVAIILGITAIVYNVLKIIAWVRNNTK